MRVRFVGSGDAFGSGGRWQTCIHLAAEGQVVLVNCGATSLTALKAQTLDPGNVGAVAVTHLHGDHFAGLPFLILDGQFSRRTAPLLVAGPPGIRARLTEAMETLFPGSSRAARRFPVEVTELETDGTPAGLGAATVRGWEVEHACGAPPLALRVELGGASTLLVGGEMSFFRANFSGGEVSFYGAVFSGGKADFTAARFSAGRIDFGAVRFSGSKVDFREAVFTGAEVNFSEPLDWSHPPTFGWDTAPPGVRLPATLGPR